jgi:hypothetical protein
MAVRCDHLQAEPIQKLKGRLAGLQVGAKGTGLIT